MRRRTDATANRYPLALAVASPRRDLGILIDGKGIGMSMVAMTRQTVRTHLIEAARPTLEAMIEGIVGVKVLSMHHDISTATGEKVVVFTLAESPTFRETTKTSH